MTVVEFQVSTAAFLAALKTTLKTTQFCAPTPIPVGPVMGVGPVQVVIDRIEFGDNSLRHNLKTEHSIYYDYLGTPTLMPPIDAFRVQIAQQVTVYVTTLNDLMANPDGAPHYLVPVSGTIVMDLDFYAADPPDQTCYMATWYSGFELGPLPFLPADFDPKRVPPPISVDDITQMVNRYLASIIQPRTVPFDVLGWLPVKPSKLLIVNAGVSTDGQLQRLAFRVEIGPPAVNPDVPWQNFYAGFLDDRLGGADWGLFLMGSYISSVVQELIYEGVAGALPDQLELFVSTSYSNPGGKAVIMNDILGIYHLPDPFGSLESNPHIPITVSVATPDVVAIDVNLPNIKELITSFIPEWAKIFLRFSGPVGAFLSAIIDSAISDIGTPALPPECKWTDPNNLHCTKTVNIPAIPGVASPHLTALLALDDGISLTGPLNITPYTTGTLQMTHDEFRFRPPNFSCSSAGPEVVAAFSNSPSDFDILHAEVIVDYSGTLPAYICGVVPVNDPLGVFPASAIRWDSPTATSEVVVHPPIPPPNYYDGPYPCDLLVKTTVGVRLVRIPPPPKLTKADVDRLVADMVVKLGNCEQLIDSWFRMHHGYNPQWGVDPERKEDVIHLWQVEVGGLEPGEAVSLSDSRQRELVTSSARMTGEAVRVSALVLPSTSQQELTIMHRGSPSSVGTRQLDRTVAGTAPVRSLAITQQLIIRLGTIPLPGTCLDAHLVSLKGRPCIVAVTRDGAVAYEVTPGSNSPARLAASWWKGDGTLRGALRWRNHGLLLYGEGGLELLDEEGGRVQGGETARRCDEIVAAVAGPEALYAATPDEIGIYTPGLCRVHTLQTERCRSLLMTGGKLVVADRNGISVYDMPHPYHARLNFTRQEVPVQRLVRPLDAEAGSFLAVLEDGSAKSLRLATAHNGEVQFEETARFPTVPWSADAFRLKDLLVAVGANRTSLDISRFGASS